MWLSNGTKEFVDQLADTHRVVDLYALILAHFAKLSLVHTIDIDPAILLDSVDHREATIGRLKLYRVLPYLNGRRA